MVNKSFKIREYVKEILKKPAPESNFRYRDVLFFAQFIRPVWKLGAISLVLTIITTGLGSLLPLSSKVLIDFIIMKKGFQGVENLLKSLNLESIIPITKYFLESLNLVVLSMLIIGITIGLIGLIQRYLIFRFQQELTFNLQTTLFDHLLRFPMSFFKRKQTGYLMSRVSDDVEALQYLFSQNLSQMVTSIFYLFFGIAILFSLSVKLFLISISILPAYVFINYYFGGRLRNVSLNEMENTAQVSKDIQEVLSGVEVIKAYSTEEREVQKVSGKMRSVIHTRIKSTILSLLSNYSARASQLISTLLIMWFGAKEIIKGSMTIGDYVAFTTYVIYLANSINSLSMIHIMLQPIFASLGRLMEIFRLSPEFKDEEKPKSLAKLDKVNGEIKFEDVSFCYEEGQPVLENISFTAHPGEIIALVGPSGAGKTTLINLILKFYTPQSGSIYLDGLDIKKISSKWLREQIGVVSQEVFLFNDTIEKNMKYGKPYATKEEVIDVAKMANIHKDIERFANKYETEIGERGIRLSAGQRQRISIARAFLKNPPILIFDEPTSALDTDTESLIKDSLKKLTGNRTTFIIAHRLSIIDIAHKILVLQKGKIVETKTNLSTSVSR
jgi:ABC-type multidrug transport system fused ATPase/permease subunit